MKAVNSLILFGKHPAWSDHMYVTSDPAVSHNLKRIFYDHSIIPTLQQGGDDAPKIPKEWSFLVFVEAQVFCVVSVPSRDSVGRSRFPLMAAYPLPQGFCLEAASVQLCTLREELRALLDSILAPSEDDCESWQADVTRQAGSFSSKVDWSSVDSSSESSKLPQPMLTSLMTRLLDGRDALNLQSCSYTEACMLVKVSLKQFKSQVPALLILDQADCGAALLFVFDQNGGFRIQRQLHGNLPLLTVASDNVSPRVVRLLGSSAAKQDRLWMLKEIPSLKIDIGKENSSVMSISRKHIFIAAGAALVFSILIGILFGSIVNDSSSAKPEAHKAQSFPARDEWILNASHYVDWVQPLMEYVQEHPEEITTQDPVARALSLELNPFSVVNHGEVRMDYVKNPTNRIFHAKNIDKLNDVYANIAQLINSLTFYYKQNFANSLSADLRERGYQPAPFITVDFSVQPIQPDLGPNLIQQFDACIKDHYVLNEFVESIKALEAKIIEPLDQIYPEHANLIRRYFQTIIAESDNSEIFQNQYSKLSQALLYPDFVQTDNLHLEALSLDIEWLDLLEQEASLQSMNNLVDLLGAYQKIKADKFKILQISFGQSIERILAQVQQMLSDFPEANLEHEEIQKQINSISREMNRACQPDIMIQRTYDEAIASSKLAAEALNELRRRLELQRQQLVKPN